MKLFRFVVLVVFLTLSYVGYGQDTCSCQAKGTDGHLPNKIEKLFSYDRFNKSFGKIIISQEMYNKFLSGYFYHQRGMSGMCAVGKVVSKDKIVIGINGYEPILFNFTPCDVPIDLYYELEYLYMQDSREYLALKPQYLSIEFPSNVMRKAGTDCSWSIIVNCNGLGLFFDSSDFSFEQENAEFDAFCASPMELGKSGCTILFDKATKLKYAIDISSKQHLIHTHCPMITPSGDTVSFQSLSSDGKNVSITFTLTEEQHNNVKLNKYIRKTFSNVKIRPMTEVRGKMEFYEIRTYDYVVDYKRKK